MAQVGFLDPTEPEVLQQLREMHPGQREDLPSLPACASYTALTSNQKFVKFLKTKICKGQAPGPSGWTGEMILPLIEDPDVMELLAYFLNDFKNGLLPKELKPYLLPANLLALKKKNSTKPRPVAVGELFYRIVTSWSVDSQSKTAADILAPINLGLGFPGGVETVVHFIHTLLTERNFGFAGIATDLSNAYNNRERKVMLETLYSFPELKSIWRLADWSYTTQTPLWLKNKKGEIVTCIPSANGVRQGCGLGALLFALSTKKIFEQTEIENKKVFSIAIMDDYYILGPPKEVLKAYRSFADRCQKDGSLNLNFDKGK